MRYSKNINLLSTVICRYIAKKAIVAKTKDQLFSGIYFHTVDEFTFEANAIARRIEYAIPSETERLKVLYSMCDLGLLVSDGRKTGGRKITKRFWTDFFVGYCGVHLTKDSQRKLWENLDEIKNKKRIKTT